MLVLLFLTCFVFFSFVSFFSIVTTAIVRKVDVVAWIAFLLHFVVVIIAFVEAGPRKAPQGLDKSMCVRAVSDLRR